MKNIVYCFVCVLLAAHGFAHTEQSSVSVETLAQTATSWNGTLLPSYPSGQPQVTLLKITVPPRTQLPLHTHPVINAGVLLEGALTVKTTDNEVLHLRAGDAIVELVGKAHYGINEDDVPAVIIVFYAGVLGTPITVIEK